MPLADYDDNLMRAELMAKGSASWNISKDDQLAIKALLKEREELLEEIAKLRNIQKSSIFSNTDVICKQTMNEDAFDLCEEIYQLIDELPDNDKAIKFGESVAIKVKSIHQYLEKREITEIQFQSLINMKAGLEKWIH